MRSRCPSLPKDAKRTFNRLSISILQTAATGGTVNHHPVNRRELVPGLAIRPGGDSRGGGGASDAAPCGGDAVYRTGRRDDRVGRPAGDHSGSQAAGYCIRKVGWRPWGE